MTTTLIIILYSLLLLLALKRLRRNWNELHPGRRNFMAILIVITSLLFFSWLLITFR
jgi:hypothetical protein